MVEGRLKSGTYRRLQVRTPGGRTVQHYVKRKPKQAKCGNCGKLLHGIPRGRKSDIMKLSKTERRPERPYGGVLCSACMRAKIIEKVRAK